MKLELEAEDYGEEEKKKNGMLPLFFLSFNLQLV